MRLSIVILAKNEELNLPLALASVKWADEIIVGVDKTSTDKTEKIARDHGCKVTLVDLSSGFATAKNSLIDKATMEWILILDADERVTDGLHHEIVKTIANPDKAAYRMPFHNNLLGSFMNYGGWSPDYKLRLIKNGFGRYENKEIHEQMQVDGEVGLLKHSMEHYTHRTVKEILRRIDQYSDLDAPIYEKGMPAKIRGRNLVMPALKEFYRRYIKLRGYKDGVVGLIEAILQSGYIFIGHAKAWELRKK